MGKNGNALKIEKGHSYFFDYSIKKYIAGEFDKIKFFDNNTGRYVRLHSKQIQAFKLLNNGVTKFVGYGGAARGGKSWLICLWLILESFAYPGTVSLLGRCELQNLYRTTWKTMQELFVNFGLKDGTDYKHDKQRNVLTFSNGSVILLFDTKYKPSDPLNTKYGSLEITRAAIDESNETSLKIVNMIAARVGTKLNFMYKKKGKILEAFNPDVNHVNNRYWQPYDRGTEGENRKFIPALPIDNPSPEAQQWVQEKEIDYRNGDMSEAEYQRLVKGNFNYHDHPDLLFDSLKLFEMFENYHVLSTSVRALTCDLALRADRFVMMYWEGLVVRAIYVYEQLTPEELFRELKSKAISHGVPEQNIIYDADGMGEMVGAFIPGAIPFHNGVKALNGENYENLKTQCYYLLANYIKFNKIWIAIPGELDVSAHIREELSAYMKKPLEPKKIKMSSKKEIKEAIGRSPDLADALAMRMYAEIPINISTNIKTF